LKALFLKSIYKSYQREPFPNESILPPLFFTYSKLILILIVSFVVAKKITLLSVAPSTCVAFFSRFCLLSPPSSSAQKASRYSRLHRRGPPLFHIRGAPHAENYSGSRLITAAHRGGIGHCRCQWRTAQQQAFTGRSRCPAAPSPAVSALVERCLPADSSDAVADAWAVLHCLTFLEAVRIGITEGYSCFPILFPVRLID
jgi:hypothetical protein